MTVHQVYSHGVTGASRWPQPSIGQHDGVVPRCWLGMSLPSHVVRLCIRNSATIHVTQCKYLAEWLNSCRTHAGSLSGSPLVSLGG